MEMVKEHYYPSDNKQFSEYINNFIKHPGDRLVFLNKVYHYKEHNKELVYDLGHLLEPKYGLDEVCFEDEVSDYHIRGLVINTLITWKICSLSDISSYNGQPIKWSSLQDIDTYDYIKEHGDRTDYTDEMRFTFLRMYIDFLH